MSLYRYDVGNYAIASTNLDFYRNLAPADSKYYSSAQWGKLASEILQVSDYNNTW